MAVTKNKLSGSTDGKGILIAATSSPGTTIHQATGLTSGENWDEIIIYFTNNHTAALEVVIEWGGTTDPNDVHRITIPAKSGDFLVIPGWILRNSLYVKAYCATTNKIVASGYVHEIRAA